MIYAMLVGALAGFLASSLIRGESYGLLVNTLIGFLGGVLGKFIFAFMGLGPTSFIGDIIAGTVGACLLIFGFSEERKRRHQRTKNRG